MFLIWKLGTVLASGGAWHVVVDNGGVTVEGMSVLMTRTILLNGAGSALRAWKGAAFGALLCLAAAMPAHAAFTADFTVDFNSLNPGVTNGGFSSSPGCTNPNYSIGNLLTCAFRAAGYSATGTVTESGGITSDTYNGEGFVVGPKVGGVRTSYTLYNMDGGTFLKNNTSVDLGEDSDKIVITFSIPIALSSISFDYEIFPDGTCPSLSNCGGSGHPNLPDISVNLNSNTTPIFDRFSVLPGTSVGAIVPCTSSSESTQTNCGGGGSNITAYTKSPNSGSSTELAPQLLGSSGVIALGSHQSVTTLTFNDWPATIGINHIRFTVPEPGSLILLGTGLVALGILRRRKRI